MMRSVSPVLFGLPDSANYVTFLEGNQLASRGQAAHTLGAAYAVSAIGGLVGVLVFAFCAPHRRPSRAFVTQRFRGHGVRCDSVVRSRDTGVAQFGSDAEGTGGCGVGCAARHERPRPIRGAAALCFRRIGPVAQFLRDRGSHRRPRPGGSDRPDGGPAAALAPGDAGQQERGSSRRLLWARQVAHRCAAGLLRRPGRCHAGHWHGIGALALLCAGYIPHEGQEGVRPGISGRAAPGGISGGRRRCGRRDSNRPGRDTRQPRVGVRPRCHTVVRHRSWSSDAGTER